VRLGVAAKLIAAYVELTEDFKEEFERFLAFQVYGENGMQSYLPASDDGVDSAGQFLADEHSTVGLHEPWAEWAQGIRRASLNDFERREAVRTMLGALIRQKDRFRFSGLELRNAAKGTLGWTRWDAKHSSGLRSKGFRTKSEVEAWTVKLVVKLVDDEPARPTKRS
jgi:hypothetical protein